MVENTCLPPLSYYTCNDSLAPPESNVYTHAENPRVLRYKTPHGTSD